MEGSGTYAAGGAFFPLEKQSIQDLHTTATSADSFGKGIIDFGSGTPDLDYFPRRQWLSAIRQAILDSPASVYGYQSPEGRPELRAVMAEYLRKTRGIVCAPDNIVFTSGSKQSLTLIAKCLLGPESSFVIEDPTNINVLKIFSYHTQNIRPVPVDEKGIITKLLPGNIKPALIFTTPSNQYPMGGVLPIQRRIDLVRYAEENGSMIVEDDYDSEFQYDDRLPVSMKELAPDNVVYIGTFSKVLMPALRLGYIVLPQRLLKLFREYKYLSDQHSNPVYQLAVTRFIEEGILEKHIKRMKKIYRKRRDCLVDCLQQNFHEEVRIYGKSAGMHIVAEFSTTELTRQKLERIAGAGLKITPVSDHAIDKADHSNQLILGYAGLKEEDILKGIAKLKIALENCI
jgi:GntR family transcriptional regulator/MocR family aminotransferase